MPEITIPFELTANTTARASEVMANFNAIVNVVNGSIEAVNLADLSVSTGKLQDSAVTTEKINDAAVTTAKLNDEAVTTAKLADDAVTSAKIPDGNVLNRHMTHLQHITNSMRMWFSRVNSSDGSLESAWVPDDTEGSKIGTGHYRVTHPFSSASLTIVATALSTSTPAPARFVTVTQTTTGQFDIYVYDLNGNLVDATVAVMVMGSGTLA